MNKSLRTAFFSLATVLLALLPAFGQQDDQTPQNLDKLAGVYEFEAPDYGIITVSIEVTEEKALTLSAMNAPAAPLVHVEGNFWELNSPDFGLISIGFVEEEDGSISAITIDGYEFSFIAPKKKQ